MNFRNWSDVGNFPGVQEFTSSHAFVQLFPKVCILEVSIKAFRIYGSVSGFRLKVVFGYPYPVANSLSCRISNRQTR